MQDFDTSLTQERLHSLLNYDPETGQFRWRVTRTNSTPAGSIAGASHCHGYIRIRVDGFLYLAHRLAWFYVHGQWPTQLDHENRITSDNRLGNLRVVPTLGHNQANRGLFRNNTSGYKGVYRLPSGNYRARIEMDGKKLNLGTFTAADIAGAAYEAASLRLFGEFAIGMGGLAHVRVD